MNARQMRVSDSERERVAQFLREQSLEGRLDHEELEDRLGLAYAAKTVGQLEDLIEDLPHRRVPSRPQHDRQPVRYKGHPPIPLVVLLCEIGLIAMPGLAVGGMAVVFAVSIGMMALVFGLGFAFGPFILIGLLVSRAFRRRPPQRRHHHQHWSPRY
jgi:hypothetical protein